MDTELRRLERDPEHAQRAMALRCRRGECCGHAPLEKVSIPKLPNLWYENENGDKWVPDLSGDLPEPPEGFIYQHSHFPSTVRTSIFRMVVPAEVAACDHITIRPTGGWIDGVEGRECMACQGSQTRELPAEWPETWDAHGSRSVATFNSGACRELATLLIRAGVDLDTALVYAAESCEKCTNVMLNRLGSEDGYAEESEEAAKCGTTCKFCLER